jgi:hypothetical protein
MPAEDVLLVGTVHADLWGFGRLQTALELIEPGVVAVETNVQRAALYQGRFEYNALALYREAQAKYMRILDLFLSDADVFEKRRERYAEAGVEWNERQVAAMEAGAVLLCACYGFELKVAVRYVELAPGAELRLIDLPEENVDAIRQSKGVETGRPSPQNLAFFAAHREALDHGLAGFVTVVSALQDAYYADAAGTLRSAYERGVAGWASLPTDDYYRRAMFDPRREPYMADEIRAIRREKSGDRLVVVVGATHLAGLDGLLADCPHALLALSEVTLSQAA